MEQSALGRTGGWLRRCGLAYAAAVVLWIALMAASQGGGTLDEQLRLVAAGSLLHTLTFVNASLISFPLVALMALLALRVPARRRPGRREVAGVCLMLVYSALATVAYGSQYTILPHLLAAGDPAARQWFFANPASIPYALDLLGYAVLGVAGFAVAYRLLHERGITRATGLSILAMGVANLAGFAGFVTGNQALALGVTIGGVISLATGLLAAVWGTRLARRTSYYHNAIE